jgi:hypothetical protein
MFLIFKKLSKGLQMIWKQHFNEFFSIYTLHNNIMQKLIGDENENI